MRNFAKSRRLFRVNSCPLRTGTVSSCNGGILINAVMRVSTSHAGNWADRLSMAFTVSASSDRTGGAGQNHRLGRTSPVLPLSSDDLHRWAVMTSDLRGRRFLSGLEVSLTLAVPRSPFVESSPFLCPTLSSPYATPKLLLESLVSMMYRALLWHI